MDNKQWQAEQAQFNDTSKYHDIIEQPRHISTAHLRMPRQDRAGQFAPFAALTGYKELLDQTAQRYANKEYPTAANLKATFTFFQQLSLSSPVKLKLTFFNGQSGYYDHYQGTVQQINWPQQVVIFTDRTRIALRNIKEVTILKED